MSESVKVYPEESGVLKLSGKGCSLRAREQISKTRELSTRFPILNEVFKSWLKPIQVLLLYFVDEPIKGRITDGIVTAYYVNGEIDKIIVQRLENKDSTKWKEDLVKAYFAKSVGKPFFGFSSSILHYLGDKLGADY